MNKKVCVSNRNDSGFTLLEIIIVIIIIGVLTSLALPRLFKMVERSRATEAFAAIITIRSAMERCYLMNNGTYLGCQLNQPPGSNSLDIGDPGRSPGAFFSYVAEPDMTGGYRIEAFYNEGSSPAMLSFWNSNGIIHRDASGIFGGIW